MNKISVVFVAILLAIAIPVTALAESKTKDLFTIDRTYHMAVSILFDQEKPAVSFTAPDGTVIDGTSLRSDSGDDWVQYYIPDADAGTWKITYDQKSNSKFEVNYSSYMDSIAIDDFWFDITDKDNVSAHFTVTGSASEICQWQIYAVVMEDETVVGERLLTEGSAALGDAVNHNVYIGDLVDYPNYHLRLDVWQKNGVEEVYDTRIAADTVAASGHTSGDAIDDFRVELNVADGDLLIDWGEWTRYGDYLVAVFDDAVSLTEPFYYTEITDGRTQAEALFDPGVDTLRIEIIEKNNGNNTPANSKTISINNGVKITAPASGLTNAFQTRIEYDVPRDITAEVIVNGKSETVNLSGTGNFSINLPDAYNEAELRYSLADPNVIYIVKFDVIIDIIPPVLRLPENKTAIRVDTKEYILAGVTEADAVLQINGETGVVNADGTFIHNISLAAGENLIKVTATDRAGNVTAQDVIITRTGGVNSGTVSSGGGFWDTVTRYLPLIISFIISISLLLTKRIVSKGYCKTNNKRLYILRSVRNTAIIIGSACFAAGSYFLWKYITLNKLSESEDYFILAQNSIDEAYTALQDTIFCIQMLKYTGIGICCCLVMIIISGLIIKTAVPKYVCPDCGTKHTKPVKFCGKCGGNMP